MRERDVITGFRDVRLLAGSDNLVPLPADVGT